MEDLNLQKIRKENGFSIRELVEDFGRSYSHIERLEKNPKNARVCELEKYLGLIGYGVDIIEFIKECLYPSYEEEKTLVDFVELNEKLKEERKRTDFYYNENLHLLSENETLKKEIENYKQIVLKLSTEKYCN